MRIASDSLNPYFFGKCSTAEFKRSACQKEKQVLILIFLENALRLSLISQNLPSSVIVLILIFLENALRPNPAIVICQDRAAVLILIFLENALRPVQ